MHGYRWLFDWDAYVRHYWHYFVINIIMQFARLKNSKEQYSCHIKVIVVM